MPPISAPTGAGTGRISVLPPIIVTTPPISASTGAGTGWIGALPPIIVTMPPISAPTGAENRPERQFVLAIGKVTRIQPENTALVEEVGVKPEGLVPAGERGMQGLGRQPSRERPGKLSCFFGV